MADDLWDDLAWRAAAIAEVDDLERKVAQRAPGRSANVARLQELYAEYHRRLPRPVVCPDPFTGEPVRLGVDTGGLDGPWWDLEGPSRPVDEPLPPTYFAHHGAIRVEGQPEKTSHTAWLGASAPYVVPRLLLPGGVLAVVSELRVGRHRAWVTVYFTPPPQPSVRRVCEWGRSTYRVRKGAPTGPFSFDEAFVYPPEWDLDLVPWLEESRLLWATPGDPGAPLRAGATGCPYVGLHRRGDPEGLGIVGYGKLRYDAYEGGRAGVSNPNLA